MASLSGVQSTLALLIAQKLFTELSGKASALAKLGAEVKNDGRYPGLLAEIDGFIESFHTDIETPWKTGAPPFPNSSWDTTEGAAAAKALLNAYIYQADQLLARAEMVLRKPFVPGAPGGVLLPNGTRLGGGGVHTGPGGHGPGIGGAPSLPGNMGGLLGSLGGNRSGRGPGGSQFMPGIGFFPGAGPGPGGVGHGVGGIGLGGSDEPPGPWTGGGSFKKHSGGGTGRQPGDGGSGGKRTGGGSSEHTKGSGDRGGGGGDRDRENYGGGGGPPTTPGVGGGGYQPTDKSQEKASGSPVQGMPGGTPPTSTPSGTLGGEPPTNQPPPNDPEDPEGDGGEGDEWEGSGGGESAPIKKGGSFTPHGGSTGGVGVMVAGGYGVRVPGSPVSYLDFLYKNVGPQDDGWGGNNPVVTPGIKPSDLFKPADDSIGPYNPKGTDYRPAPDDPTPGGPAGAAGRATRVRNG